jgi:hypothetical protein
MSSVSKPLLGVLAAVVIVAVLWTVALSPGGGGGGASSPGAIGSYQGDINKARASAAAQDAAAAAANGSSASASPNVAGASPSVAGASPSVAGATPAAGSHGPASVQAALRAGRVVALVFYNPGGADDQAVRAELDSIPSSPRLLRLAVPISQVADYPAISLSVPIQSTPTLVIVNARRQATVITGFVSRFAIAARIRAALSPATG